MADAIAASHLKVRVDSEAELAAVRMKIPPWSLP
jgi:hypothetical protein